MITSALINQCRREFGDISKTIKVSRAGDAATKLFNVGSFPVIEGSYTVWKNTSAQTETTNYTLDPDNGDLTFVAAPGSGINAIAQFKYAHWRDKNWVEAINQAIETLNAKGFFRQVVRNSSIMKISANVRTYNGPSACVDLYEFLESDDSTSTGNPKNLAGNWSYQQDANKLVLGYKPSAANYAFISYLRNLQTYSATSATLDVLNDWLELIKKKAGAVFYRELAGKTAREPHANINEGHFSFTNLRTMANDLDQEFENLAIRKKPARPAKEISYHIEGGGIS